MIPINNNPYRILGLLAGASTREQSRQISRLKKYIESEQEPPTDDFSFPVLGKLLRTIESIEDASSKLNLDSDKINAALFWFWNGNPITDEVAFEALKEGNMEEAYQIWDKLIVKTKEDGERVWRPVTEKNASAFHNCFVLEMLRVKGNKHNAIVSNLYFLESEFSQKFISAIADSTYKTSPKALQIIFLNEVLQEVQKSTVNLPLSKLVSILNSIKFIAKDDFLKSISQKFVDNISAQIEIAKKQRTTNKANAAKAGDTLCTQTKADLKQLKSIVGVQGIAYSNIADKVANEVLQCSVYFFNHSQETSANNDYHNISMNLAQLAKGIAVGNLIKERIEDNINTLEEMKDREILQAIELLKSVKEAYEQACRQIDKQVDELQYYTVPEDDHLPFPRIGLGFGRPGARIPRPGVSINWSKVEEMKRNAIAWDKVVDLVKQVIPPQNIEKIKAVQNQAKINEYKNLVNFLHGKVGSMEKREIQYLDYWSPPSRTQTQPSSNPTNTYKPPTFSSSNSSNEKSWAEENPGCLVALIIGSIIFLISILSNLSN